MRDWTRQEILTLQAGRLQTIWRFDVLDAPDEVRLGTLAGVTGGYLQQTASEQYKTTGQLTITAAPATGEEIAVGDIDWLNVHIRPVRLIDGIPEEFPRGVYVPVLDTKTMKTTGRSYPIGLVEKLTLLDGNTLAEPLELAAGTNVIDAIIQLCRESTVPLPQISIQPSTKTLGEPKLYPVGTTRLSIISELKDIADYTALTTDQFGHLTMTPYATPAERAISWQFTPGLDGKGVYSPEFTLTTNRATIPNQVTITNPALGELNPETAVAQNTDPASPYSIPGRGGRVIDHHLDLTDPLDDPNDLYDRAVRTLAEVGIPTETAKIRTPFFPAAWANGVVAFTNHREPTRWERATITSIRENFDSTSLLDIEMTKVSST